MTTEKIMLFIPMYNCERQIPRVLGRLTPAVAARFAEVVVIDNGSSDGSLEAAKAALERVRGTRVTLLRNNHNVNLGGSHKVAFNRALARGCDYLIVLHGDDQGGLEDLLPLLDQGLHRQHDALLGSRFAKGARLVGYSAFRTFGNVVFNAMISLATRRRVTDMGAGLNCYKVSALASRFYMPFPNNLTFNVYLLYYGIWKQWDFIFFPLTWREEDQLSNAKIFRQAGIILGLTWRYLSGAGRLFSGAENAYSRMDYSSTVIHERATDPA